MSVADVVLCAVVAAMVVRLYEVERELSEERKRMHELLTEASGRTEAQTRKA